MSKNKLIALLLLCSMFQFSVMIISTIIGEISLSFPDVSNGSVQLLATLPDLFIMISSIVAGKLLVNYSPRLILMIATIGFAFVAIGGTVFFKSITALVTWSVILGIAIGFLMPTIMAIVNDEFEDDEKSRLLGFQSSFVSIGAVILTALSGIIATYNWNYAYFLFFGIVPIGIYFTIKYKETSKSPKKKISFLNLNIKVVILRGLFIMIFFSLYNSLPANISFILEQKNLYSSINSSIAIVAQLFGSVVSGLFYDRLSKKFTHRIDILGISLLLSGIIIVGVAPYYGFILLGMFIAGASISIMMSASTEIVWKNEKKEYSNYSTAIVLAFSDGGGFITSLYFFASACLFKSDFYIYLIFVLVGFCLALLILSIVFSRRKNCIS